MSRSRCLHGAACWVCDWGQVCHACMRTPPLPLWAVRAKATPKLPFLPLGALLLLLRQLLVLESRPSVPWRLLDLLGPPLLPLLPLLLLPLLLLLFLFLLLLLLLLLFLLSHVLLLLPSQPLLPLRLALLAVLLLLLLPPHLHPSLIIRSLRVQPWLWHALHEPREGVGCAVARNAALARRAGLAVCGRLAAAAQFPQQAVHPAVGLLHHCQSVCQAGATSRPIPPSHAAALARGLAERCGAESGAGAINHLCVPLSLPKSFTLLLLLLAYCRLPLLLPPAAAFHAAPHNWACAIIAVKQRPLQRPLLPLW